MLKRLRRAAGRMTCARACELLPLHIAGDLPAGRAAVVAQHLRTCAACRAQADEYAASRAWLQAGAQPMFADEFYNDIRAAVLRQIRQEGTPAAPQPAPFFASLRGWRLLYVAASVALFCVAGALAWQVYSKHQPQPTMAADTRSAREPAPTPSGITSPDDPPRTGATPPPVGRANRQLIHHQVAAYAPRPHAPHTAPSARGLNSLTVQQTAAATNAPAPGTEVARIELQTADPNIRIIWLAQTQPVDPLPMKDR